MNSDFLNRLQVLNSPQWIQSLRGIKRGFEKECLRVDKQGLIAKSSHPSVLGSSLTNPMITTDYSEALLEFITPPTSDLEEPLSTLTDLHQYTYHQLTEEILWAGSMPCHLPAEKEIPIAQYGSSNLGRLKNIYRRGLGHRYGRIMQTIAGIHYNFSLPQDFWVKYHELCGSEASLQNFISEQYLGLIRNSLRFAWLLPLLFGASPAVSFSFFKGKKPDLQEWEKESFIGPNATSLRLSDLGYQNRAQSTISISYNSFSEFLQTMQQAVHTPFLEYNRIGIQKEGEYRQLSNSIFQIEDEHYALVRPKRVSQLEERMMAAMLRQGIEYVEIRALDINPFIPIGVEPDALYFLDAFLMICLLMDSPPLTEAENERIAYNQKEVATRGREPKLCLVDEYGNSRELTHWAIEFIEKMQPVAILLDKTYGLTVFSEACKVAKVRIVEPDSLPSSRVLWEMREHRESYFDFAWRWSLNHQKYFKNKKMSSAKLEYYTQVAEKSILAQMELERASSALPFNEYLYRYLEA